MLSWMGSHCIHEAYEMLWLIITIHMVVNQLTIKNQQLWLFINELFRMVLNSMIINEGCWRLLRIITMNNDNGQLIYRLSTLWS